MIGITNNDFNLADVTTIDMTATGNHTTAVPNVTTSDGGFVATCKEAASDIRGLIPSSTVTMAALNILKYVIPTLKCNPASTAIGAVCILLNKEEKLSRRIVFATLFIIASQLTLISGVPFAQPLFMAVSAYQHGTLLMHAFAGLTIASAIYELAKGFLGSRSAVSGILQPGLSQVAQTGGNLLIGATGSSIAGSLLQGAPSLGAFASSAMAPADLLSFGDNGALNGLCDYDSQELGSAFAGNSAYYEDINGLKTADALESLHAGLTESSLQPINSGWASEFDPKLGTNISQLPLSGRLAEQWGHEYENFSLPDGFSTAFPKGFNEAWNEAERKGPDFIKTAATVLTVGSLASLAYRHREEIQQVATKAFNWTSVFFGEESDNLPLEA